MVLVGVQQDLTVHGRRQRQFLNRLALEALLDFLFGFVDLPGVVQPTTIRLWGASLLFMFASRLVGLLLLNSTPNVTLNPSIP